MDFDDDLSGILFDLDGVVYNDDRLVPGAPEALQWVRERGIPYLFITNTTSRSRASLAEKLAAFGIPAGPEDIVTPAAAAAEWLRGGAHGEIALFVRGSAREEFQGLPCLPAGAESGASHVVVGDLGEEWDFRTLNRAFRLLHHNPSAQLMALGMTRYWLAADGISLDAGPFVAALEYATGRKAKVFGKPAAPFFYAAADKLELPALRMLMVGDDVEADIGGAQAAGLKGALVRTGKFRAADLEGPVLPYLVWNSIADLPEWWSAQKWARG